MIYISIPASEIESANAWCKENVDPHGDTFVVNQESQDTGEKYCLISIPDDGSPYAEAMKKRFGSIEKTPRQEVSVKVSLIGKVLGKVMKPEELKLQDIAVN